MNQVVADERSGRSSLNFLGPVEVCDESGRVIARLFPTLDPSQYEPMEPQISKEELQRRKQSKGKTYSTAEVLARLKKL